MTEQKLGFMVTVEGVDGCGKTTVINQMKDALTEVGIPVIAVPGLGGTAFADQCKQLLISTEHNLGFYSQIHLIAALRKDIYDKIIRPAIIAGQIVLIDRWVDSSITMQGWGSVYNQPISIEQKFQRAEALTKEIINITNSTIGLVQPRFTLLIDIDQETQLERLVNRTEDLDVFERKEPEFFNMVRLGYEHLVKVDARNRITRISNADLDRFKPTDELLSFLSKVETEYHQA